MKLEYLHEENIKNVNTPNKNQNVSVSFENNILQKKIPKNISIFQYPSCYSDESNF